MPIEKVLTYKIRLDDGDLGRAAERIGRSQQQTAQQAAQARGRQQQQAASGPSYPATPRTRRPSAPGQQQSGQGVAGALNNLLGAFRHATRGFGMGMGPNSYLGQTLRGFGMGGNNPFANFARFFVGNLNIPFTQRLLGRIGTGAGTGATRAVLGRVLGGAAVRGLGGAMAGAGGAAIAGAGPIGLAVAAAVVAFENFKKGMSKVIGSLHNFGQAFITGEASQAMHGLVNYTQGVAQIVGGPIFGTLASKFIGVAHSFIDAMDQMVQAFGRWSPIVSNLQAQYQVHQLRFQMRMSRALEPLLAGWMKLKILVLDGLAEVFERLINFGKAIYHFDAAIAKVAGAILKFMPITLMFEGLAKVVGWVHDGFMKLIGVMFNFMDSLADFMKSQFGVDGGIIDEIKKGYNSLRKAIFGDDEAKKKAADNSMAQQFLGMFKPSGLTSPFNADRFKGISPLPNIAHGFFRGKRFDPNTGDSEDQSGVLGSGIPDRTKISYALRFRPGVGEGDYSADSYGFILGGKKGKPKDTWGTLATPVDPLSSSDLGGRLGGIKLPGIPMADSSSGLKSVAPALDSHSNMSFTQKVNLSFQANLAHEQQVWQSMMQARDHLLSEMGRTKDETILLVSAFNPAPGLGM